MIYIGIDPGASGGIGVIDTTQDTADAIPYNDEALIETLTEHLNAKVMVEKVGAMPGQGVTSMFNFGKAFGFILGSLATLQIPYQLVPARTWKREFSLDSDKKKSIACCKQLFPSVTLRRNMHCRTDHDGMAEALLIAEYARRRMK